MAVGDDAAAAGYPIVPNTGEEGKAKYGAREINRTRDFLGQAISNLARRKYANATEMGTKSGLYAGQQAVTIDNQWVYEWTGTSWRFFSGWGTWSPDIIGAAPFARGSDGFSQGAWQVDQRHFILSARFVFGGGTNFDTSGQHVAVTQLPTDFIAMDYVNTSIGLGLYRPKNSGPAMVPVMVIPNGNGQLDLRLFNTRGSMAYADESFSAIAGEQQSDEFRFTLSGFRTN